MRGLLDIASGSYGVAMVTLVTLFVFSEMTAMTFAKSLTVLLFVVGSILCVDGMLGVRSGIDRSWRKLRRGTCSRPFSVAKIGCGAAAMFLVVVGVGM